MYLLVFTILVVRCVSSYSSSVKKNVGSVSAVYDLVGRVIGDDDDTVREVFDLQVDAGICGERSCVELQTANGKIRIVGTSASEVSYGVGVYLREFCNMTYGWPRGGGKRMLTLYAERETRNFRTS